MKKSMFVLVIVFAILISGCSEIEAKLPPIKQDKIEDIDFVEPEKETYQEPYGNYILLRYYSSGTFGKQMIFADLYLLDQVVCTWDLGSTQPEDRGEILYFAPVTGNCEGLDPRNGVTWNTIEHSAQLLFQEDLEGEPVVIDTLEVWIQTSTGYQILQ